MASGKKQIQQFARQLFKLSFENGALSGERVGGVLAYVERHRPAHPVAVLKAYQRLIAIEIARSQAVIEHAGTVSPAVVDRITAALAKRYARKITGVSRRNDALLAGLRVRVGDDVFESSIAGQLAALASAV